MNRKEGLEFIKDKEYIENPFPFGNGFSVPWEVMDEDLTLWEKIILSMVISFVSNEQEFYMSNEFLATKFNLSIKTISRAVKNLHVLGYITSYHKHTRISIKTVGRVLEPAGKYYLPTSRDDKFVYKEYIYN